MLFRCFRLAIVLIVVATGAASAVEQLLAPSEHPAEQQKMVQELAAKADDLEQKIADNAEDDAELVNIRLKLEEMLREAQESAAAFRTHLGEINTQLDQLGPPPGPDQPAEPQSVAEERASLGSRKAEINTAISATQALSNQISGQVARIAAVRSELFRSMLTRRYALSGIFGSKVISDTRAEWTSFRTSVTSWLAFAFTYKFQAVLVATLMALCAATVLLVGGRRLFGGLVEHDPALEDPSYLARLSVAFWSTLLPTMALGVFFAATFFFFTYSQVLRGDIGVFLRAFMLAFLAVFCVNRLANAALAPDLPRWRLIPVASRPARWLVGLATVLALAIAINGFLSEVTSQMSSPLSLTVARSFLAAVIVGLVLILIGMVRPFRTRDGEWKPWPAWLRYGAFGLGLFTIAAALLGYVGLAIFAAMQIVATGTLLMTAYIGYLSARAIGEEGGFGGTPLGQWLASHTKLEEAGVDQLGLAISLAINLMILLVFLPLILLTWGFQLGDIQAWAYKLATGVTIGSVTISVTGILSGIVVFVIGFFLTRWFQGWLDGSVMARGHVDAGVRNSIRLAVGYAGVAIAGLVGISAAGIDLSSLALVAGALSLGVGFGLQNVVSNFVSGLILLAERPFKVGDWIVAGDVSGTVKKISVRATEIETFQRQSVILPNSNLINGAVGNWTHRNKLGRVEIRIGVANGSDARRAHQIMLEVAREQPLVLKNPEPFVQFVNFGPAAMEFEIRVFLADILNGNSVQNEIRFAVLEAFEREGIRAS